MHAVSVQEYLKLKVTLNCDDPCCDTNQLHQNTHNLDKKLPNFFLGVLPAERLSMQRPASLHHFGG